MNALWTLTYYSGVQFARDKVALFWTLAFPVVLMVIIGFAFGESNSASMPVGLVVLDEGPAGQTITQVLEGIELFDLTIGSGEDELAALGKGDRRAVVILPDNLSAAWQRREVATIGVHLDTSQQQSAGTALSIVQQVVEGVQREFTQQPSLVAIETHSVQAEHFRPIDYIAPGILALSVAQLGLFGATTLVEQRQQRLLRRLQATPISRWMVLLSNIVVRLAIALVQTGILLGVALALFRIQVVGSWPAIIGIVVFGTLAFIALGFLLGGLAPNAEALIAIVQMINFPMMFLSGALFPLDFMPEFLRPVAVVLPLTYLADILRQIMVDATPYATVLQGMGVLLLFMVASALLAWRSFRWE
ncbi:MAG: ABC transporter permease [Chloroflexota bacterium]|nr:ABC transporter permease [Chloroflexota bacterium]MDE2839452.1 ABC transporter permease [Chloroflexota bacterium]MDE2929821.1 ABC transporter permease [Chloroflexota bacterium]